MRQRATVVVLSLLGVLAMHPNAVAETVDCGGHHPIDDHVVVGADGANNVTNTGLDGVSADVFVPNWTSTNLRGQATTVADVAMNIEDSSKHYFQLGWYVGQAGGLTATSTPKVFFGEGVTSPTVAETLTTLVGIPLATGREHNFRVQRIADPDPAFNWHYAAYVDGAQVWTSVMSSTLEGTPSVVGETNWRCADLYERATTPLGGATLKGHRAGGTWSLWQQHYDVHLFAAYDQPACWYVSRVAAQTATSIAYDQC